ncbi:MAG: molybdopterin-dependent oxidoreductase [Acidobacteriota bacterium]
MSDKQTLSIAERPWPVRGLSLDLDDFALRVFGAVEKELVIDWPNLTRRTPTRSVQADLDATTVRAQTRQWTGAPLEGLLEEAGISPTASCVTAYSEGGYYTHLRLYDLLDGNPILAYEVDGRPLTRSDGGPVRLVLPRLAPWRSAKWVRGLEIEKLQTC